jgi:hypothetical protein
LQRQRAGAPAQEGLGLCVDHGADVGGDGGRLSGLGGAVGALDPGQRPADRDVTGIEAVVRQPGAQP